MSNDESIRTASEMASAFGSLIRSRRRALNMRQHELALATGVGRRFLIELEAGKASCHLGRSLMVAHALGIAPADILSGGAQAYADAAPDTRQDTGRDTGRDLPDLTEEAESPDGSPPRLF
jgi:transcriptional regulator with XRE-family HTH domain